MTAIGSFKGTGKNIFFIWVKSKIFQTIPGGTPYNGLYREAPPKP